jgi:hypothetical protein
MLKLNGKLWFVLKQLTLLIFWREHWATVADRMLLINIADLASFLWWFLQTARFFINETRLSQHSFDDVVDEDVWLVYNDKVVFSGKHIKNDVSVTSTKAGQQLFCLAVLPCCRGPGT